MRRQAWRATTLISRVLPRYRVTAGRYLVIAPHPDDETLGCGGVIAVAVRRGSDVHVLFATDGERSDRLHRPPETVAAVRRGEGVAACGVLGVPPSRVSFLGLPDGELHELAGPLGDAIAERVAAVGPDVVLVCSPADRHTDHVAVFEATARAAGPIAVHQYLVWARRDWPRSLWKYAARGGAVRGLWPFTVSLSRTRRLVVGDQLPQLRGAWRAHDSQMGTGEHLGGIDRRMADEQLSSVEIVQLDRCHLAPTRLRPGSNLRTRVRTGFPTLHRIAVAPLRAVRKRRHRREHRRNSPADRTTLEQVVLPALRAGAGAGAVLFVGVEWYTATYAAMFPARTLVTLDVDPAMARYGATRHVVGDVTRVAELFAPETFAAVVCNGVLGFGVDDAAAASTMLTGLRTVVRPGGAVVLGWNDVDPWRPHDLDAAITASGLRAAPAAGLAGGHNPPLGPWRHVYTSLRRPDA